MINRLRLSAQVRSRIRSWPSCPLSLLLISSPPIILITPLPAKLFTRDKPKLAKVTPASRDVPPRSDFRRLFRGTVQHSNIILPFLSFSRPPFSFFLVFRLLIHVRCVPFRQQEFQTSRPHQSHYQSIQPLYQLRSLLPSHDAHHHTTTSSDGDNWHVLAADPNNAPEPPKLVPLSSSRSSSLGSSPPGVSSPLVNPQPVNSPRTVSPFMGTPQLRSSHPNDTREREKDGRSANPAVGTSTPQTPGYRPCPPTPTSHVRFAVTTPLCTHPAKVPFAKKKEERGGSWSWEDPGDRDCHRRDIRDRDDGQQDLHRMIGISSSWPDSLPPIIPDFFLPLGYLTAIACEDWAVVIDVCERASATKANAKEAAKALSREFKCVSTSISCRTSLI